MAIVEKKICGKKSTLEIHGKKSTLYSLAQHSIRLTNCV